MCRPQNVRIAWITLTPTAVAAADTVLSKWWYLLAVVHVARLCYYTLTPYTAKHLLCLDNESANVLQSHFILECSYMSTTILKNGLC